MQNNTEKELKNVNEGFVKLKTPVILAGVLV
jgi:hypothetical protein